jgi:hypothetical protein
MNPQETIRLLRTIRFGPTRGRRRGISWLARETGCSRQVLYNIIRTGWCSRPMARRLSVLFKSVNLSNGHIALANAEPLERDLRGRYRAGSGKRPRPWPRPVANALPAEDIAPNSRNEFSNHLQDAPLSPGITLSFQHLWARTLGERKR